MERKEGQEERERSRVGLSGPKQDKSMNKMNSRFDILSSNLEFNAYQLCDLEQVPDS